MYESLVSSCIVKIWHLIVLLKMFWFGECSFVFLQLLILGAKMRRLETDVVITNRKGARQVVMSSCSISTETQIRRVCRKNLVTTVSHSRKNSETAGAGSQWNVTKWTY